MLLRKKTDTILTQHQTQHKNKDKIMFTAVVRVQEAQLPLRNRASAMYFFVAKLLSIAVMTYSCV